MDAVSVSMGTRVFLVCMAALAGFIDSAAGGGGLISLPAFLAAGLPVHMVYGTNKFTAACGTTFSTANYLRSGAIDLPIAAMAAVGSFIGSSAAARLVLLLSDRVLQILLLVMLPIAAVIILWRRNMPDEDRSAEMPLKKRLLLALCIGLAIGAYDGLIGPGTGTFAILAFTAIIGYSMKNAGGNAKALNLASNYASLVVYLLNGYVVFSIAIPCAIGNIAGNLLGSTLALKKGAAFIRPMLLVVLVLLLARVVSGMIG